MSGRGRLLRWFGTILAVISAIQVGILVRAHLHGEFEVASLIPRRGVRFHSGSRDIEESLDTSRLEHELSALGELRRGSARSREGAISAEHTTSSFSAGDPHLKTAADSNVHLAEQREGVGGVAARQPIVTTGRAAELDAEDSTIRHAGGLKEGEAAPFSRVTPHTHGFELSHSASQPLAASENPEQGNGEEGEVQESTPHTADPPSHKGLAVPSMTPPALGAMLKDERSKLPSVEEEGEMTGGHGTRAPASDLHEEGEDGAADDVIARSNRAVDKTTQHGRGSKDFDAKRGRVGEEAPARASRKNGGVPLSVRATTDRVAGVGGKSDSPDLDEGEEDDVGEAGKDEGRSRAVAAAELGRMTGGDPRPGHGDGSYGDGEGIFDRGADAFKGAGVGGTQTGNKDPPLIKGGLAAFSGFTGISSVPSKSKAGANSLDHERGEDGYENGDEDGAHERNVADSRVSRSASSVEDVHSAEGGGVGDEVDRINDGGDKEAVQQRSDADDGNGDSSNGAGEGRSVRLDENDVAGPVGDTGYGDDGAMGNSEGGSVLGSFGGDRDGGNVGQGREGDRGNRGDGSTRRVSLDEIGEEGEPGNANKDARADRDAGNGDGAVDVSLDDVADDQDDGNGNQGGRGGDVGDVAKDSRVVGEVGGTSKGVQGEWIHGKAGDGAEDIGLGSLGEDGGNAKRGGGGRERDVEADDGAEDNLDDSGDGGSTSKGGAGGGVNAEADDGVNDLSLDDSAEDDGYANNAGRRGEGVDVEAGDGAKAVIFNSARDDGGHVNEDKGVGGVADSDAAGGVSLYDTNDNGDGGDEMKREGREADGDAGDGVKGVSLYDIDEGGNRGNEKKGGGGGADRGAGDGEGVVGLHGIDEDGNRGNEKQGGGGGADSDAGDEGGVGDVGVGTHGDGGNVNQARGGIGADSEVGEGAPDPNHDDPNHDVGDADNGVGEDGDGDTGGIGDQDAIAAVRAIDAPVDTGSVTKHRGASSDATEAEARRALDTDNGRDSPSNARSRESASATHNKSPGGQGAIPPPSVGQRLDSKLVGLSAVSTEPSLKASVEANEDEAPDAQEAQDVVEAAEMGEAADAEEPGIDDVGLEDANVESHVVKPREDAVQVHNPIQEGGDRHSNSAVVEAATSKDTHAHSSRSHKEAGPAAHRELKSKEKINGKMKIDKKKDHAKKDKGKHKGKHTSGPGGTDKKGKEHLAKATHKDNADAKSKGKGKGSIPGGARRSSDRGTLHEEKLLSTADRSTSSARAAGGVERFVPLLPQHPPEVSPAEARAQTKRDKILAQLRAAKAGGNIEKRLALKWNMMMPTRNVEYFPAPAQSAIPIILLVYKRTMYLEAALRLYSVVRGINTTTLVISHQGTDQTVWGLVERITFCRVKQFIFPYRHGMRGAPALKLHFAWAIAETFAQLEVNEVLYMEDDYWPTPDFYLSAVWLQAQREQHCPECVGSIVGDHPRDWTEQHANAHVWLGSERLRWLHRPNVVCSYNSPAGISMPLRSWRVIAQPSSGFCDRRVPAYDDAIHAMQNERQDQRRILEPGWLALSYPRCLHVGRCEGISFRADKLPGSDVERVCNASSDLVTFTETWVAPWFDGGLLANSFSLQPSSVVNHPRSSWRIPEGLTACRIRYKHDPETGQLAGVALTNHTMPKTFEELCSGILRFADPMRNVQR